MKQIISCHKGKCFETIKGSTPQFDDLFETDTIVDEIERDLWRNSGY
jgi:hypothetical protein